MNKNETPRMVAFRDFCQSFHGKKLAQAITEYEFDQVVEFIQDFEPLGHLPFEYAVNRWHIDDKNKPKNLFIMMEMLLSVNTRAYGVNKAKRS